MKLIHLFLQLIQIITTLRGASGETEQSQFDDLHIKFEKHIEFEDDWEDDFYQSFSKGKTNQEEQQNEQLWIDWSEVEDDEFLEAIQFDDEEVLLSDIEEEDENETAISGADESFFTAPSEHADEIFNVSIDSDEGLLQFDDSYEFIPGVSDSESDTSGDELDDNEITYVFNVNPDEFYESVLGEIQGALDAVQDLSEDEEFFDNLKVIKGSLAKDAQDVKEVFEETFKETVEVVQQKWEVLSENEWKEFDDEQSVFDYIAKQLKETVSNMADNNKTEQSLPTDEEALIQV